MSALSRSRLARGVIRFGRLWLVDPVRAGRIVDTGWPPGLRVVVTWASAAFWLAVLIIVASPILRAWLPLSVSNGTPQLSLPRMLLPLFFFLVLLSVCLAQTAVLHARWLVAIPVTLVTVLLLLFLGGLDQGEGLEGAIAVPGKIVALIAVAGLVALLILRRRHRFAWGEFVAVVVLVSLSATVSIARVAAQSIPFGIDFGPTTASLMMSSLGSLAAPAALAAGIAIAELAITAALAIVGGLRVRKSRSDAVEPPGDATHLESAASESVPTARPATGSEPGRRILWGAFLVLTALLVADIVARYVTGASSAPALSAFPGTAVLIGVVIAGWVGLGVVRRGVAGGAPDSEPVKTADLLGRLSGIVFPVAAAFTAILGPVVVLLLLTQVLTHWGIGREVATAAFVIIGLANSSTVIMVVRIIAGLAFLTLAVLQARRGRRGTPELLAAFGVIVLISNAPTLFGFTIEWTSEAISVLIAATTVVLAVVLHAQRRLGTGALAALCVALLLAEAAAWRDVLANPLSALLGASAIAFILLGFVWGFIAGAAPTRSGSVAYPVPARVLLFLANSVFGVTVLAFAALARDLDVVINLDQFAGAGDLLFGTALIIVVVTALWAEVVPADRAARHDGMDKMPSRVG